MVERQPSKLKVAGSSLVSRSNQLWTANQFSIQVENGISRLLISNENYFSADINTADVAQLVERIHGKDEVLGSNPSRGSIEKSPLQIEGIFLWSDLRSSQYTELRLPC